MAKSPAVAPPNELGLVEQCAWQLSAAAEAYRGQDSRKAEMVDMARGLLTAALGRPEVMAAFADSFSHPGIVLARLDIPTPQNLDQASDELFRIVYALTDQRVATEMLDLIGSLQPIGGPTPLDTFYAAPGDPDRAVMPLYGCRTSDVLAIGLIEGSEQLRSAGQQGLFYPVGGYDRFARASSVVVTQNLADGLAIDAAMAADMSCSVIVASHPEGVLDVSKDVRQALVNRMAVAASIDREAASLVVALAQTTSPDSWQVRALVHEGPSNGVTVVVPGAGPADVTAIWSMLEPGAIAATVRSAGAQSSMRLHDAATGHDERLDHGSGFRDRIRDLQASIREAPATTDTPPKVEKRTLSVARRV